MAIHVRLPISLSDERGAAPGTLLKVSDRTLLVQSPGTFELARPLEFRFEPEGGRAGVSGTAEVVQLQPPADADDETAYALRILGMNDDARTAFRTWLYELSQAGGTASRPPPSQPGAAGSERTISTISSVSSLLGSLARTGGGNPTGRGAVREAMRSSFRASSDKRSGPSSEDVKRPAVTDRAKTGIEIRVEPGCAPPRITVTFHDPERFRAMYRDHLDQDILFVRLGTTEVVAGTVLEVRIVLPGEEIFRLPGRIVAVLPSGTAILLTLDEGHRFRLQKAAQAP